MGRINLFYIAVIVIGISLVIILRPDFHDELSFYGFAESNETDINYNHAVVVDEIRVTPGQAVSRGDTLMKLTRRKSREILEDQEYRIAELRAEEAIWVQSRTSDLEQLRAELNAQLEIFDKEVNSKQNELNFQKSLSEGLTTIQSSESTYNSIQDEIAEIKAKRQSFIIEQNLKISNLEEALKIGTNPYREQINRLGAEREFEESQMIIPITVVAPADGIIGNISCKEAEHIPSYSTLMTFYEPHSGLIHGYVHEDLTLKVAIGDNFDITSLKDERISYVGTVIGLGSRIVEIPTRLRKIPDVKTYGREVQLEITRDNIFLQKEKVSISYIESRE